MAIGTNARMGYGGVLGFGDETTFGTTATTIDKVLEFNSASFTKSIGGKVLESLGTGRGGGRRVTTQVEVEGTINFNLHPVDGIKLLKHALMGTVTSAALSAPAYAHTFTAGNMDGISEQGLTFNLRPSDTTDAFHITGAKINSLKISAETGAEAVTAEISLIAKGMTVGTFFTTGSVTFSTVRPFLPQDVTISIDGANEDIISMELTCPENNLQNDANARSLGSKTLAVLPAAQRGLGLTLTQRFDTVTAWNRHKNESAMAIIITIDTGQTIGTLQPLTYKLQCDLPKVYYDSGGPPEVGDSGILTHELSIIPVLDTLTGGKDIVFSAWNTTTSY
jgi:Phage tail tube protein